jgi:hypothetical protein
MKLFDGADFNGWKYRPASWKVDARMPGTGGYRNSGVVYRGKISNAANFQVSGYQVDISDNYWGSFYHEQGSELPWTPVSNCSPANKTDWATLEIVVNKDKVTHLVNGRKYFQAR